MRLLKLYLRRLAYFMLGCVSLLVIVLIVGVAINFHDETLSPEALALLKQRAHTADTAQNGFFVLLAMDASEELDPAQTGRNVALAQESLHKEKPHRSDYESAARYKKTVEYSWPKDFCTAKTVNCVDAILSGRQRATAAMSQNSLYLRRYELMQRLPKFEEHVLSSIVAPLPRYHFLVGGSEMALVAAIYDIADGRHKAGMEKIKANDLYVRRLLRQTSTLIGRMVAVALVRKQVRLVSELIEHYPRLIQEHGDVLVEVTKPLALAEQDYSEVMKTEARFGLSAIDWVASGANWEAIWSDESEHSLASRIWDHTPTWFFQPNATRNLMAAWWAPVIQHASEPATQYASLRYILDEQHENLAPHGIPYVHYLSNPVGKLLTANGVTSNLWINYFERVADVDGYLRAVALQLDIRRQKIPDESIDQFVKTAAPLFRSPYDGIPMDWDLKTKQLRFIGRQKATSNAEGGNVYVVQLR